MDEVRRQFEKISSNEFICKCLVKTQNSNDEEIEKPCGEIIIIGKESYWNLKRHLNRKHEKVLRQIEAEVGGTGKKNKKNSFAWKHFSQLNKGEVMCQLCLETIKTSDGSTTDMLKHLNSAHADEIKPDIEQFNKENVDGAPAKALKPRRGKQAMSAGKKNNKKALSTEDFRSPISRQFIRDQFAGEKLQAICLWCSTRINHSLCSGDLGPLVHHMLFSHRAICEKGLAAKMHKRRLVGGKGSFSPKFIAAKKRSGATEKFTRKSSSLFAFDKSDDEELYDVHCGSQVETDKTTEQLSDLRIGWLKFCSEREKVHDLEVARLRMRLREKQLALHELEREVESMTEELDEKLRCRRQELIHQRVLDSRILTKKAMHVREKFYNFSSLADKDMAIDNNDDRYDSLDGYDDKYEDGLQFNYGSAKRRHRESNLNDSDRDWEPEPRAKRSRHTRSFTTVHIDCTPASSKKRLTNGNSADTNSNLQDELEVKEFRDRVAAISASSLKPQTSPPLPNRVPNNTDATNVEANNILSSESIRIKTDTTFNAHPADEDVIVPVIFETTVSKTDELI